MSDITNIFTTLPEFSSLDAGTLYLVPTPIGNLCDISLRSLYVLANADLLLAEDTRTTALLLSNYGIKKPLLSYHQHNEKSRIEEIKAQLQVGKTLALVSDAGMPCISDPGQILVNALRRANIPVIALPGSNAALTALASSGLPSTVFSFVGFLPRKQTELQSALDRLAQSNLALLSTWIIYEAPHRLTKTLLAIAGHEYWQEAQVVLLREISKKYEEYQVGSADALLKLLADKPARGEYVMLLHRAITNSENRQPESSISNFMGLLQSLAKTDLSTRDILTILQETAPIYNWQLPKKNQLYKLIQKLKD